jgi:hypothetical protein
MLSFEHLEEKTKREAVIQYVKLLNQKNPENIVQEGKNIFSHTNTRGRKRILIPCRTFSEYQRREKEYSKKTKMQKCLGYYVLEIVDK